MQVGSYAFHFDLKLTIYSSGLPTTLHYHHPQNFPLLSVNMISSLPHQKIMDPQRPQQGASECQLSKTMGTSSDTPFAETQPTTTQTPLSPLRHCKCCHLKMILDAQSNIRRKPRSSINEKQHAMRCEYCRIEVDGCQLMI